MTAAARPSESATVLVLRQALATVFLCYVVLGSASARGEEAPPVNEIVAATPGHFPPQYSVDENGNAAGFAIDVMNEVAKLAGIKVTYLVTPNWKSAAEALEAGRADIIPNSGISPERAKQRDHTAPVETFSVSIFVRKSSNFVRGLPDLAGRTIALEQTNVANRLLKDRQDLDLKTFDTNKDALFELLAGHVDAIASPVPVLLKLAREIGVEDRIKIVGAPLAEIKRAIAMSKGNAALLDRLSAAVKQFVGSPEYQKIYMKWYGRPDPYWSVSRIIWFMGALLLLTLGVMAGWRHYSMLRLNRALSDSEARLKGITDNLPGGVYRRVRHADGTFCYPYVSEGFRRIYRLDSDRVKASAQNFIDRLHPEDRDRAERAVRESAETLGAYDEEYRVIGEDGKATWCRSIAQPRMENGDIVWDGVAVDITEQKRAQAEIQDLNERLERRVEERTGELRAAQEELVRKERLAALGQLTGTVSHELRNPLGALRAAAATVKKLTEGDQPAVTKTVAIIDRSITRCDNIIADLLDYSRGDCAALAPTRVDPWLGEVLDEYPLPPWLEMSRKIETGARAMVDRERLRRVLINLLDNACQAMAGATDHEPAPGDHRLRVTARRAGDGVEISVADTGPGIAPEDREKVFEPLFSTKAFGVGLGLSIVKQIIGQHGGRIAVGEAAGGGTCFTLFLPLAGEPHEAAGTAVASESLGA